MIVLILTWWVNFVNVWRCFIFWASFWSVVPSVFPVLHWPCGSSVSGFPALESGAWDCWSSPLSFWVTGCSVNSNYVRIEWRGRGLRFCTWRRPSWSTLRIGAKSYSSTGRCCSRTRQSALYMIFGVHDFSIWSFIFVAMPSSSLSTERET